MSGGEPIVVAGPRRRQGSGTPFGHVADPDAMERCCEIWRHLGADDCASGMNAEQGAFIERARRMLTVALEAEINTYEGGRLRVRTQQ
ncbi:hypothetical protein ACFYV5_30745 [Streptomyces sp. NPDC003035]|uniref:hypothetical protein n=1 Tax=Streptomyces sp. NPDC003035 TaxID=3364676 RepID=UPI00369A7410